MVEMVIAGTLNEFSAALLTKKEFSHVAVRAFLEELP